MPIKKYSLKWRLVLSITGAFMLIWAVAFAWLYFNLERKMTEALDERLSASAHMVARLLSQIPPNQLLNAVEPAVSELNQQHLIACEVSLYSSDAVINKTVVARTRGAPQGLVDRPEGLSTWTENGTQWRSYTLKRAPLQVVAAEKIMMRNQLLSEILQSILWPLLLTLLFCIGLVFWIIKKEFRPIEHTAQLLKLHKDQPEQDLNFIYQLEKTRVPLELQSFVENISELLLRLQRSLENEKNFSAFAAHELRSPLTAIKVNVQLSQMIAQQQQSHADVSECLAEAERNIVRYQQLLEQLLILSQTEHQQTRLNPALDLKPVFTQVLAQLSINYTDIQQRVQVDWASLSHLQLPPQALNMVLINLIENSLKHGHSVEAIQIYQHDHALYIEDFGVGLNTQDIHLAKQRFWRKSAQSQGYGLGLALTESLLDKNAYQLILEAKKPQGLLAIIRLKPSTTEVQ